jgi:hypothetical protein
MLIPDIGLRTRHYAEERWLYSARPVLHPAAEQHDEMFHEKGISTGGDEGAVPGKH